MFIPSYEVFIFVFIITWPAKTYIFIVIIILVKCLSMQQLIKLIIVEFMQIYCICIYLNLFAVI